MEAAQERGFLGPAPVEEHWRHALGFAAAIAGSETKMPSTALDLGAGGGVPGLALAEHWPSSRWTLLDAELRRVRFLAEAVEDLGWGQRVTVVHARAEEAARTDMRGSVELVCARSFGSPAVTAECGAPFLRVGGVLVVSDPPSGGGDRWPAAGVAELGLDVSAHVAVDGGHFTVLRQAQPTPEKYPRRPSARTRHPLF
ncbi:MAG: class I SAM-dependent methyltransferase [Actinobacteria bacterium]|nr:class I SAM-dependent methyltransferase [Actinomycetota bacterium]